MPKYAEDKIFNHYLYFTSHCTVEAMHAKWSRKSKQGFYVGR